MSTEKSCLPRNPCHRWLIGLFLAGVLLRCWSFQQNTRLYGDVNLFALTARQLALYGRLTYPMKYDYTPQAPYLTLESPASQHPPLWPLFGAVFARLWDTADTFLMLKVLAFLIGLCLWIGFLPKPEARPCFSQLLPFGLIAISPWLIDFSTNGSPYILITLILIFAEWLWKANLPGRVSLMVSLGAFSALAILTHANLILLPLSFGIKILSDPRSAQGKKVLHVGIFALALFICLSPWFIWNVHTFAQWVHTPSAYYLLEQLRLAFITYEEGRVVWTVQAAPMPIILQRYSLLFAKSLWAGLRQYLAMVTPIGFFFILAGLTPCLEAIKSNAGNHSLKRLFISFSSPMLLYLLTIAFWATYKTRFLIPLLPPSYLLIGEGVKVLHQRMKAGAWLLWLGVGLLGLLTILPYRQQPLNFYYGAETAAHARQYDHMKSLAEQLGHQPRGVVLGVANSLDGGIETIYWSKQPFVTGRGIEASLWKQLAIDFQVRYLWGECQQAQEIRQVFAASQLLLSNGFYCVFGLP
ncbi:MAG: hypothetical protein DDG59_08915 [Anaerolineae bacterium]|nr:MAG: hypothetical protein DDG59_08915 [Anaerolineae bacterium]